MATLYRNDSTRRLVRLIRTTPLNVMGSYLETEDYYTGERHKITATGIHSLDNLTLVAED